MRKAMLLFVALGIGLGVSCDAAGRTGDDAVVEKATVRLPSAAEWPVLKEYDQEHLARIAMPLGGIGTGTVSLGGRGDLRDWEIMNRPAKGFVPTRGSFSPFFAVFVKDAKGRTQTRALEGPIDLSDYEASHGSTAINHGLPRFRQCTFAAAYPLGQVMLSDREMLVDVTLQAFNPLVPADPDASGIPVAILRYALRNKTNQPLQVSVCGVMPNFVGMDGSGQTKDWKGDLVAVGGKANRNGYREGKSVRGIFMDSEGVAERAEQWGTMALSTPTRGEITHRISWIPGGWGSSGLDFWDDFSADGKLDPREPAKEDTPMASLAVSVELPPKQAVPVVFLLTWHFPNRMTWTRKGNDEDRIGNYYTTQYKDAWEVAEKAAPQVGVLEDRTLRFVRAFCESGLPEVVKEAALFNLSTLRSQTCFRTEDGRFYGFEGSSNRGGCCHGSCTHVWNYEHATAMLFGSLAMSMREVEFAQATNDEGMMSFRVNLPLSRAKEYGKAAADGQMGCIMKMYRDWQLSGDDAMLKALWPHVKKAFEFCWIPGGWDADTDGVMEGCQHNTMDVEYYGPNPQMGIWYLGALRAAEEMARHVGDAQFAATCRDLFERGSKWTDANLFNGRYYEHKIQPPSDESQIAASLLVGMGAKNPTQPDYQLGAGCLVDQLVGQYTAHVCGLGYLVDRDHVRTTLGSIMKYNYRENLYDHFNCMRSFALGGESALLMAAYPKERPNNPFPYFTEVMTGFEYTAAVGMLYEGQTKEGLKCIENIRNRYDGRKRSPFNEAECGHHYARAMASWAAVLALTGFRYSGVDKSMSLSPNDGMHFWSNGYAWGTCVIKRSGRRMDVTLSVLQGDLTLAKFNLTGHGSRVFDKPLQVAAGQRATFGVTRAK
ncbi:MAG TPA: GH116 family glycosyl-hydrolase [Sedimentisphaerales bacterium]|nr:GH116 family glycosyl-hydrolase [Sedimentisphaerales bacterium]